MKLPSPRPSSHSQATGRGRVSDYSQCTAKESRTSAPSEPPRPLNGLPLALGNGFSRAPGGFVPASDVSLFISMENVQFNAMLRGALRA